MNKIWLFLVSISVIALIIYNPAAALPAMMTGANDALKLSISLIAVYALWMGIMEILDATGLSTKLSNLLKPLIRLLFPGISDETTKYISLNLSANIIGIGGAATPLGIKAMETMDDLSGAATSNMILFAVINSASLQLLPTTVIGLRAAAGSAAPADTVLIGIIAQAAACVAGVLLCKIISIIQSPKRKKLKIQAAVKK